MLVFFEQNLVFLAVPKTGSTAFEMALRGKADIIFAKRRKHTTAMRYQNKVAPFLADTFELRPQVMAVMRDPISQIRSWYRYRQSLAPTNKRCTIGMSFDEYVLDVIKDDPPDHAGIGSQFNFLTSPRDQLLVDHLFAYEAQDVFQSFLNTNFGDDWQMKQRNVSPKVPAPLSSQVEEKLRQARSREFALYQQVIDAGGHLVNDR